MDTMKDVNIHLENKSESRHFFWFIWIMYAVVYMTKSCYSAALADIVRDGVLTKSQTGFISGAFYVVYAPLQILGGIIADKRSPEKLIIFGLLGGAVANAIIFFNQNYYVMLGVWLFNAVSQFAIWPSIFKIYSSQLCRSDRPKMVFYMSFSTTAGMLLAYLVAALLPGWEYNFAVSGVALLFFAVLMYLFSKHLNRFMKKDYTQEDAPDKAEVVDVKISDLKLFLLSGLFTMLPVIIIRAVVANSVKSLAPTMLMESYDNISPSIGNLLNLFIIASGMVGTILVKKIYYPRYIKNELLAYMPVALLAVPFLFILKNIGNVSILLVIISMCFISALMTAVTLMQSYFNMRYVRFGKNGTAAGIANCAGAVGIILQNYAVLWLADGLGWSAVSTLWIVLVIILPVFLLIAFLQWKSFSKRKDI